MSPDRLLGTWDVTMDHHAVDEPVAGRQVYTSILDGAYVHLDWTYEHDEFPDAVALLAETRMHYFDVRGLTRVFEVEWDDAGYTMVKADPEFAQRFTARFEGPDVLVTTGEYSEDGGATWSYDFTTTARRSAGHPVS